MTTSRKLGANDKNSVLERLRSGDDPSKVTEWLVSRGHSLERAERIVERLDDRVQRELAADARVYGSVPDRRRNRTQYVAGVSIAGMGVMILLATLAVASRAGGVIVLPLGMIATGLSMTARAHGGRR